jgi:hypothetical protein
VNPAAARRAELWMAGLVLAVGLWGLLLAREVSFAGPKGARIADSVQFSPLGALVTMALALLCLAGAVLDRQRLVLAGGLGFGLAAIAVLVTMGGDANWLGARGSNFSLLLGAGVGLAAVAVTPRNGGVGSEKRPNGVDGVGFGR